MAGTDSGWQQRYNSFYYVQAGGAKQTLTGTLSWKFIAPSPSCVGLNLSHGSWPTSSSFAHKVAINATGQLARALRVLAGHWYTYSNQTIGDTCPSEQYILAIHSFSNTMATITLRSAPCLAIGKSQPYKAFG